MMTKYNSITFIVILISLLLQPCKAEAQQTIDPTVEVQRDFDGKMTNIHKSRLNSQIHDSLSRFNLSFNYSIFNKPYKDLYEFSPLPAAELQSKVEEKFPVFLAKAGINFPVAPFAEIYFQPLMKGGNTFQINALYNGFYGKLNTLRIEQQNLKIVKDKQLKPYAGHSALGIGGNYGYHWGTGELGLEIGYNTNYNTYYGFNTENMFNTTNDSFYAKTEKSSFMNDSCSHHWNQIGAKFHIGTLDAKGRGAKIHYKAEIEYSLTSDKLPEQSKIYNTTSNNYKLEENLIKVYGEFGPTFGRYNKFTVGFNSENVIYSGIQDYKYGLYEVIPQYSFEKGRLKLKAGVKISGRYKSKDNTDRYHNTLFAKGDLSFEIAKNNFWLYAGIDGGNLLNNYSSLLGENRWISQSADLIASSVPFLIKGGFRGQIHNKFSYNIYARYTAHEGLVQYLGNIVPAENQSDYYDSRLYTIYSNHREFSIGGELKWESKEFTAGTTVEYSDYTKSKNSTLEDGIQPLGYAPFQWHLYAKYNYRERVWIGVTSDYRSSAPTWSATFHKSDIEYEPFLNLGLNIQYVANRSLSVFLNADNLLNQQIQYYPQYLEKGISFGFGVLVKL